MRKSQKKKTLFGFKFFKQANKNLGVKIPKLLEDTCLRTVFFLFHLIIRLGGSFEFFDKKCQKFDTKNIFYD